MRDDLIYLLLKLNKPGKGILKIEDINKYADKLIKFATIICYYERAQLKGFIGYYRNDLAAKKAYLSIIAVDETFQGEGIGKGLLRYSIEDIKLRGFDVYGLEVLKSNQKALKMYMSSGFVIKENRGELWLMEKKVSE